MDLPQLSEQLGGVGRARLAWDLYKIGIDPAIFFKDQDVGDDAGDPLGSGFFLAKEDFESIQKLLPSSRRTQTLGTDALTKLESMYQNSGGQLEGGVASISMVSRCSDSTTKLLLRLKDGLEIETVIIPWDGVRSTLCISSQVGCKQGCKFCATGRMGKLRSLTSDEILAQMFFARKVCRLEALPPIQNVVFMGLGEPADNAENVVASTKILTTRGAFQLSATKVMVSTVAPDPSSFQQFVDAPCILAWSVHAVNDELRRRLVPTTKYPMVELRQGLIDTLNARPAKLRTVMLEIVLLDGVNDSLGHADELAAFAKVIIDSVQKCKLVLNLIPYNPIKGGEFGKPSMETCSEFQKHLQFEHNLRAFVRVTRGDDESAACGQLITTKSR